MSETFSSKTFLWLVGLLFLFVGAFYTILKPSSFSKPSNRAGETETVQNQSISFGLKKGLVQLVPKEYRISDSELLEIASGLFDPNLQRTGELIHYISAFSSFHGNEFLKNPQYKTLIDTILSNPKNFDIENRRIGKTRNGIRFLESSRCENGESHPNQVLAVLASIGVPRNYPFTLFDSKFTLADLESDCEAMFSLHGEYEWAVLALFHIDKSRKYFKNRFGESFSSNEIAIALLNRPPGLGPCFGCHVYEALVLLESNSREVGLSPNIKKTITELLNATQDFLCKIQESDGSVPHSWGRLFFESIEFQQLVKHNELFAQIAADKQYPNLVVPSVEVATPAATSHHLDWIIHRAKFEEMPPEFFIRSNRFLANWTLTIIRQVGDGPLGMQYVCAVSHSFHVLSLLN